MSTSSSLKNLLYDERYANYGDRRYHGWHDRYWSDRFYDGDRHYHWNHPLGRSYYHNRHWPLHYWNPKYYENWSNKSDEGTLRFNRHTEVPTTKLYYPAGHPYHGNHPYPLGHPWYDSYYGNYKHPWHDGYAPPMWTAPANLKPAEVKIERMPLKRSNSFVSVVETKAEGEEQCVEESKSIKANSGSKSCSNMDTEIKPVINNVSFVYENDNDKHRHVTYVKQTTSDAESAAGNMVKASSGFLPVNRSVGCGPIFNGNSFGILSEHLTIRDTFHVAFQFKTTQQNGVLMSIVDRSSGDAFFVELYDSQLKATLFVDGEADSCWSDFETSVLSNDIWSDVEVNIVNNRMSMTVRNEVFTKTHRFPFRRPIRGDLFVAGYPSTATPPFVCHSKDFFVGEMRNFFLNNDGVKWYGSPSHINPRLRNWYF